MAGVEQEVEKEGGMGSAVSVLAQTVTGLQASHSSTGLPHSIIRSDDALHDSTSPDLMTCTTVPYPPLHRDSRCSAQETMGVAYQRMTGSLQQSLQMMQQMNGKLDLSARML